MQEFTHNHYPTQQGRYRLQLCLGRFPCGPRGGGGRADINHPIGEGEVFRGVCVHVCVCDMCLCNVCDCVVSVVCVFGGVVCVCDT